MISGPPCELLEWDTAFFGFRTGRVIRNRILASEVPAILEWCDAQKLSCLYFLCSPDHDESVRLAEGNGFHLVDVRMEYLWIPSHREKAVPPDPASESARPVVPGDVPWIEKIAADSYTGTRYYFDERFPREKASALYTEWARKSCSGWADAVLVVPRKDRVGGFVTCHVDSREKGRIGLVGVDPGCRGAGIGGRVVRAAQGYFLRQGVTEVSVVTQGRNVEAQRLYQKCGFLSRNTYYWFHKWFPTPGESTDGAISNPV